METPPLMHFLAIIVLLATFTLLVVAIPYEFYVSAEEYRQREVPEYFEALELEKYASTYCINITEEHFEDYWGKTEFGYDMLFQAWTNHPTDGHIIWNIHGYTFWGAWTGGHSQEWINQNGVSRDKRLRDEEIDADFDIETEYAEYTVKCKHFQMKAWIHYDVSAFSCSKDAWDNYDSEPFNGLSVLFGIEFDEMGTGMNAWNLIGMILFFQIPEIHPVLNMIIATPLWACIAWLTFAFIIAVLKSLPFT